MQQGLDYAETLKIPFVFSSNGDGFVFHDRTGSSAEKETTIGLDAFPSPDDLWARYRAWKGLTPEAEAVVLQDYHDDGSGKVPRYYQVNAINAAIESIAKGADRILLVMATGTGKTYTAFQIIWRLWKAGRKKRILFLADRNVLVDQTMVNDFRPFGAAMAKLSTKAKTIERADGSSGELTSALDGRRRIDTAYEIYLGLYQAITGPEERQKLFREFSPGFFDLIVIDECHRGSAAEDSAWREILEYFSEDTSKLNFTLIDFRGATSHFADPDFDGEPEQTYEPGEYYTPARSRPSWWTASTPPGRDAVRPRRRRRRLPDLCAAPHAQALREAARGREEHAGCAPRRGEEAASTHALRQKHAAARHRRPELRPPR